jgi:hypothetical protein
MEIVAQYLFYGCNAMVRIGGPQKRDARLLMDSNTRYIGEPNKQTAARGLR